MSSRKIAFVGTGVMGASMAGHLIDAGHNLTVYNRTPGKADGLVARGAARAESAGEAAAGAEVVITIVGFPVDVEEVYFAPGGILEKSSNALLIDMTTSRPDLAVRIAEAAGKNGCRAIDAPVSGGDIGAREARLSIMAGGERGAFEEALPVLQAMGKNIVLQGGPGAGQHTKMCNQISIASGMLGICEAVAYAEKSGLDPTTVLSSIESGAAGSWSLSNLAPRIIAGNFAPGFYVKHFIKDLSIALESAESMGLKLPGLALAREMYLKLESAGGGDLGTQGLYTLYSSST